MLCSDDGFSIPKLPRLQHTEGVTICDYVKAYEDLTKSKLFPYLPDVRWEEKFFDVTVGNDILDNNKTGAMLVGEGVFTVSYVTGNSLEYVLANSNPKNRRAQEHLKRILTEEKRTRISLLAAHGETAYGKWYYFENGIPVAPVQEWIDEQSRTVQGKQGPDVLLLDCCNPSSFVPATKGVPVLYAVGIVGFCKEYTYHLVTKRVKQ